VVGYFVIRELALVQIVLLPLLAAIIFTALLRPMRVRLEGRGFPRLLATWVTFVFAFIVIGAVATFVIYRATGQFHSFRSELTDTVHKLRHFLVTGPFHLKESQLNHVGTQVSHWISQHRGVVVSGVLTGATVIAEVIAGAILTAFITFFLLYDGERIWRWVRTPFGRHISKVDAAGGAAWLTLSGYIRGSVLVATIHAVVIAVTLFVLGVPLVAPLAIIVFVTSFLPLVGVLIGGGLSVFVALGTKGLVAGIVVLIVLIIEHQIEGHLLQPFLMGRYVRLHPLAIALALAVGGVLGGIVGAIVAVPVVAVINSAWPIIVAPELEVHRVHS
jgi:predicted PurR-regulated permease PerM